MRERRLRVFARRFAVHERRRPERRGPDQIGFGEKRDGSPADSVPGAQLHHQIVGMLTVDERPALVGLARLEELRRSDAAGS